MARTDTLINFLTDVAAAIKAKKGDSTPIPAADFDTEIANLPSGDDSILISLIDRTATSFEIPEGTTSIGLYAFYCCTGLTNVTIPDSVTSIGSDAFLGCTGLTSITIPDSVTNIDNYAFSYCTGLTSVTIGNSVTSIGNHAFDYCTGLTSITIPDSVTSIGSEAFASCESLTTITVSTGNIVYHSTDNCLIETKTKTLILGCKSSVIPADGSVTSIGSSAFRGYTSLKSITIPDSVTSIGSSAFYGCTSLTSVTIPNSVTSIGYSAFYGCTNLTEIDFSTHNAVPTLADAGVFYNTSSSLVIKVPSALVDEWKAATNWVAYADKIVGV